MAPAPEERGKGGSHTDRKSWHGAASSLCLPPGTPHLEDFGETRVPHADRELPLAPRVGGPVSAATHMPSACGSPTPAFVPRGASAQMALAGPSPAAPPRGEGTRDCFDTFPHSPAGCFAFAVSAVHKETKQFFTLYNTLDDKKVYLEKEVRAFIERRNIIR